MALADNARRDALAAQLDADGHTVHTADSAATTCMKLAGPAIDVLVLGELEDAATAIGLLRDLRAGTLSSRANPAQPVARRGWWRSELCFRLTASTVNSVAVAGD